VIIIIRNSINFILNGIANQELKIINCNINNGMQEEFFMHPRELLTTQIKGRDELYLQYKNNNTFNFSVTFAFENTFTNNDLRVLKRLLNSEYFIPLQFIDESDDQTSLNYIYYIMLSDESTLTHNCLNQGYVTLNFLSKSPYCFSEYMKSQLYDLSINETYTDIQFINHGDIECKPEIYIEKVGNGDISIVNLFGGREFKFTDLLDEEELEVSSEYEIINTSLVATYRYDNHNGNFLIMLPFSVNYLRVTGTAKFYFKYQYKYL